MTHLRKLMLEELERRNYSQSTVRTYVRTIEDFARYFKRPPDQLGPEQIREYQAYLFRERKLDPNTVNQRTGALRFFFVATLKRGWSIAETPYPRKVFRLPKILSPEQVARLIDAAPTLFYRTLLMALYATGLRRAELAHLKVGDIDSERMVIHVKGGKGRKDRDVMLSPKLLAELRQYWRTLRRRPKVLDDMSELSGFISSSLTYYSNLEEELQLLSGSGTNEDLHGLLLQAQSFNTSLLTPAAGWTRLDLIGRAIQQITRSKEIPPSFVVLHPDDFWSIRLTKDGFGRYILGDPQIPVVRPQIFGLDLVSTTSMAAGTFLIGSGDAAAAEIRDRMELMVEVSTEHQDFFTKNLVAVRAEKRLALIVKRPNSLVTVRL